MNFILLCLSFLLFYISYFPPSVAKKEEKRKKEKIMNFSLIANRPRQRQSYHVNGQPTSQ